jgi:PAT family beta-lactamase induction signal transducer AmpG
MKSPAPRLSEPAPTAATASPPGSAPAKRLGTWRSLVAAMTSWRTAAVTLLSFSSGLPLGIVWVAIPDWMRSIGVDIRVVGLLTLAQAPWTFKFLWAPFMDRYVPPWLGRRRGWAAIMQVALFAITLMLAGVGGHPDTPWVVAALALAIAFASASQDIALDAYTVDVLRKDEQAVVVGARVALYRAAMMLAGGAAITLAGRFSWPLVNVGLAVLFLPMLLVTWKAPEPEVAVQPPKTLKEAIWAPFVGLLARHRALQILAFVFLYKLSDQLAQSLQRPFLVDMGYSSLDRGVALATLGMVCMVGGTFLGGALTSVMGLGRALWVFGILQATSNLSFVLLAMIGHVHRPLMYGGIGFEALASGLGTGAFSVFLMRITQRRFSATQYALFSSLFGLPRILAGPICGFLVDAVGWTSFFWFAITAGLPGLILLARFAPLGAREPTLTFEPPRPARPLRPHQLVLRGVLGALGGLLLGAGTAALLAALKAAHGTPGHPSQPFDLSAPFAATFVPSDPNGWLTFVGVVVCGLVCGLFTAAVGSARHGGARVDGEGDEEPHHEEASSAVAPRPGSHAGPTPSR